MMTHSVTITYKKTPACHHRVAGHRYITLVQIGRAPISKNTGEFRMADLDLQERVEAEIPRLRRYARALTRDVVAADDLVQDCLVRGLAKLHLWQEGTDLRAWLFTILHNQYVNGVRRAVREGSTVPVENLDTHNSHAPSQG